MCPMSTVTLRQSSFWLTRERIPIALSVILESRICPKEGARDGGMGCRRLGKKTVDYWQQENCH